MDFGLRAAEAGAGPTSGHHHEKIALGACGARGQSRLQTAPRFARARRRSAFGNAAGIFKDAPHPNTAKLYLSWVLAPDQQRRIGAFSPRADVPPPAGLKPLFSYKVANDYREFVTNERLVMDLRRRFEAAVGPIRNVGGVR